METEKLKNIIEAALLAAGRPLDVKQLEKLFDPQCDDVSRDAIRACLDGLQAEYKGRGYELKQVASGYRLQVRQEFEPWMARLWEEKPPKYSRALLETLALIAYRQPITRAEIEDVRGVGVSSGIIKTLLERGWIRGLGHKEVPGKPALYGSTQRFLDYFSLKSLDELPSLTALKDWGEVQAQLELEPNGGPNSPDENSTGAEPAQHARPADSNGAVVVPLPTRDNVR